MLTWGVAAPQTKVEANAAPSLWWHDENQNNLVKVKCSCQMFMRMNIFVHAHEHFLRVFCFSFLDSVLDSKF